MGTPLKHHRFDKIFKGGMFRTIDSQLGAWGKGAPPADKCYRFSKHTNPIRFYSKKGIVWVFQSVEFPHLFGQGVTRFLARNDAMFAITQHKARLEMLRKMVNG